ncbi:hypothetical protein ACOMHN_028306 [Nucella lapillus]
MKTKTLDPRRVTTIHQRYGDGLGVRRVVSGWVDTNDINNNNNPTTTTTTTTIIINNNNRNDNFNRNTTATTNNANKGIGIGGGNINRSLAGTLKGFAPLPCIVERRSSVASSATAVTMWKKPRATSFGDGK